MGFLVEMQACLVCTASESSNTANSGYGKHLLQKCPCHAELLCLKLENKAKVYTIRRHSRSFCTQRQPKIAAVKSAASRADLWAVSALFVDHSAHLVVGEQITVGAGDALLLGKGLDVLLLRNDHCHQEALHSKHDHMQTLSVLLE